MRFKTHHGEFDPGSEGTLAACITHAVERGRILRDLEEWRTGEEHVRIYLSVGDNFWKRELIPNMLWSERISPKDDLASD